MKKAELIAHLERDHSDVMKKRIAPHRWTVAALREVHDAIHRSRGTRP